MIARGLLREHPSAVVALKRVADIVLMLVCGWLAYTLLNSGWRIDASVREALLIGVLIASLVFEQAGAYRSMRGVRLLHEFEQLATNWTLSTAALIALLWGTGSLRELPPRWLALWFPLAFVAMAGSRFVLQRTLEKLRVRGYNRRQVVIAVASELGLQVARRLREMPSLGLEVIGFFDDRPAERLPDTHGIPVLGRVDEMVGHVRRSDIDQVWVALPFRAEGRIRQILASLRHSTVDVRLVPDVFQFFMLNQSLDEVAGIPVLTLTASPMRGLNRMVKAAEDRVLAALILLIISPLMVAVAIAVRMSSPGPVLFKQRRDGWNGDMIEVWKFRTMRAHHQAPGTITLASRNDARVTRVGAFLRRTSLDELPQFFNVLQGSMSIVGPRPHPIEINEEYKESVDRYMLRHKVKPGITGWAQVNGLRGALDTPDKMQRRVQHDLFYIEHWSLWFDLRIVLLTLFRGFMHENAY